MKKYVVDASFVLKSLLKENKSVYFVFRRTFKKARLNKIKMFAPSFILSEVANAIRYSTKDTKEALSTFDDFLSLPINFIDLDGLDYKKVIEISYTQNTTVYDTSYHVLAKAQNAVFLTCDEEYYKKAKSLGDIELIC
ncbi:MAG: type II toxin-antitoxin system VapC family toxin [bacterium]|nr:type II toxin-antitoxin system VapC family toxin [bacterium]